MRLIAHRGNLDGKIPEKENHPDYIKAAIAEGFDVEIDVWMIGNELFLAHDEPQYKISADFLLNHQDKLWCHAKNADALFYLIKNRDYFHSFSHDTDPYVLTSRGIIWAYVGKPVDKNTICVLPENTPDGTYTRENLEKCYGICSDKIEMFYELLVSNLPSCVII